jgi:hypothetical protein
VVKDRIRRAAVGYDQHRTRVDWSLIDRHAPRPRSLKLYYESSCAVWEKNSMTSMSLAAAFWLGLHLIVAGPLRSPLVDRLGERYFFGIFSLLSIAGLVWFVAAYRMAPFVPLWPLFPALGSSRCGRRRPHESDGHTRPSDDR